MKNGHQTQKQQKVVRPKPLAQLISNDAMIRREAVILEKIKDLVRQTYSRHHMMPKPPKPYPLYYRYRMPVFPLMKIHGSKLPQWRNISPWLKVQMASLVLHEIGYYQFRIHIDDGLLGIWRSEGKDIKSEFRDRLAQHLKRKYDNITPMMFFVLEGHDIDGHPTRLHVHGAVEMIRCPIPMKGYGSRRLSKLAITHPNEAQILSGRMRLKEALLSASGANLKTAQTPMGARRSMHWSKHPTQPLFNTEAVDYAFKNVKMFSTDLPDNRVVILNGQRGNGLRAQAKALWEIIRGSAAPDNHMGLPPQSQ